MTMPDVVKWALYLRESTEGQLEGVTFNSMESQETYMRKWVANGPQPGLVHAVYQDVESGTSMRGRDGLKQLLHDAAQGKFQAAVAYEQDRWARNSLDYQTIKKQLADAGVRLVSANSPFDDSPEGELMEGQMSHFHQYFSRLVSRKVKTKRGEMAEKGLWLGGRLPFGYAKRGDEIVVVQEEADVVRTIFELYARERSAASVRHQLRARGIKNRAGQDWNNTNLAHMLQNRCYLGELKNAGKTYRGPQPALIAPELFEAVQAMQPTKRRAKSKMDRPYPLIDVLHCGHCGTRLSTHYVDRGAWKIPYYRCTQTFKKTWNACPVKQVNADKMEKQVLRVLDQLSLNPDTVRHAVEAANATCSEREAGLKQQEEGLKTQLDALTSPIGKLVDVLKTVGPAGLAEVSDELRRLTDEKSLIEHELREVRQQLYELRRSTLDAGCTVEVIGELRLLYEAARPDERRELIRLAIKRITYSGPKEPVEFEFYDGAAVNLPREGSKLRIDWLQLKDSNLGPGG
jgi:site-specific DNA recombinase